jgi:hypothetical protein
VSECWTRISGYKRSVLEWLAPKAEKRTRSHLVNVAERRIATATTDEMARLEDRYSRIAQIIGDDRCPVRTAVANVYREGADFWSLARTELR